MNQEYKEQLIQDYLEGRLTEDRKQAFEKEIENNKSLAQEVADLKELELGLHSIGFEEFKMKVGEWEKEESSKTENEKRGIINWNQYFAIAASILILIFAGYFLWQKPVKSTQLYADNYVPYDDMILNRGDGDETKSDLYNGMAAYNEHNYERAANLLSSYLNKHPQEHGVALYLGIAQMEIDASGAEASFLKAQQDLKFAQQAQWFLALLHLKNNQLVKARDILFQIKNNRQHYKRKVADELIKALE